MELVYEVLTKLVRATTICDVRKHLGKTYANKLLTIQSHNNHLTCLTIKIKSILWAPRPPRGSE